MAAKESNSLVISLSIFVMLTIGLGVAWYMTWSHGADLQRQVSDMTTKANEVNTIIQNQSGELTSLKELIGHKGTAVATDEIVTGTKAEIANRAGDGSASDNTLEGAMIKNSTDRDINALAATDRQVQLNVKIAELSSLVANHENSMNSMKAAIDQKETELRDKERLHGEQLAQRETQIDGLKTQLTTVQDEYATYRTNKERAAGC